MNFFLSYWVPVFQALLTPAIAFLAVMIALCQWRTAHQRVVMDLFDRRMKIYTDCREILNRIIASPDTTTDENGHEFKRASADAEFLFRDEVVKVCKMVEKAIFDLATYNAEIREAPVGQERNDLVAHRRIAIGHIRKFYDEDFRIRLRRYMRLTQRLRW
jgi:hypothetical protein